MSLIKWNPTRSLMFRNNDWDHFLDDIFGNTLEPNHVNWTPNVDIHESESEFALKMDLPGLSKKEVGLNINDGVLIITGERSYDNRNLDAHRIERGYGKFSRSFSLPENIDTKKIKASFKNGELNITLPKTEEAISKSQKIEIS
jgi:HSP20 family protein